MAVARIIARGDSANADDDSVSSTSDGEMADADQDEGPFVASHI